MSYEGPVQETPVEVVRVANGAKWGWAISVLALLGGLLVNALMIGLFAGSLRGEIRELRGIVERVEGRIGSIESVDDGHGERITRVEEQLRAHRIASGERVEPPDE